MSSLAIRVERGREFPRTWTRDVTDFGNWMQLEPLFERLETELGEIQTPQGLLEWLRRRSELESAIAEESSRRYIAMTCRTDDPDAEAAYLNFLQQVEPHVKRWGDRLTRRYLEHPVRLRTDRERLAVLDRAWENHVRLYRDENVALEIEDQELAQQYQKIMGAMTVEWRGETRTLQQMAPLLEEPDREVREQAWRLVAARRLQDRAALDELMNRLVALRTRIARNAGFETFRDYQHQALDRFDYSPQDCETFHRAVEQTAVPRLAASRERRRRKLGTPTLRPWDTAVDPQGRPPLKPFREATELEERCARIFATIDPDLGAQFARLRELGLMDLASRKGKAPGGYQATLEEVRLPFIFMNAAGTNRDVFTLLHEAGHAFHALAARRHDLLPYRHAPHEFSEVASMGMEMIAMDLLEEFYPDPEDARRARRDHLESIVELFPWVATIDAFQHWLYTHPDHTPSEREAAWLALEARFSPGLDWTGLDAEHAASWQRQLHLYQVPFYYIEYGIAQLGALQLWLAWRRDRTAALAAYRRALALGGSRPLPELFAAAGLRFDFSAATLEPLLAAVEAELERLE